jgi:hypothetical protein
MDHVHEHDILCSETTGKHDLRRIALDRSRHDFLRLLRLERLTPDCEFPSRG